MMETAKLIDDGCVVETYANTDVFPAASGSKRLAFDELNRTLYLNNGSEWKQYDLTVPDAAAGASGSSGYSFQGSNYGYTSGGGPSYSNVIEKFAFLSDGNATDVGDLTQERAYVVGQSSSDYGYTTGGLGAPSGDQNIIDKFAFATDGNATDVGDLTTGRYASAGQSSAEYGYTAGGGPGPTLSNVIDKFPFSSDGNATDVGDMTAARNGEGQSSTDYGYISGGWLGPVINAYSNIIEKFPFSTDANATDVGDLTVPRHGSAGQSSSDYGYLSGGYQAAPVGDYLNSIDKFPFASDANATDAGDLTSAKNQITGQSSTDYGYTSGGYDGNGSLNVIDKFPFASDGNATDVGDLTATKTNLAGQQY
jgi:hypothetical protein